MTARRAAWALALGCLQFAATAQTFLEFREESVLINQSSYRGAPLSSVAGNPTGSDGRAPTTTQQSADGLTTTAPTAGQFQGAMTFGAGLHLDSASIGSATDFPALSANLRMPRGSSNDVTTIVLRRALVGGPVIAQQHSYFFGSIIVPPAKDEAGNALGANYWLPEPFSLNGHTNAPYYWSPHAQAVFAVQPGPTLVTWRKAQPDAGDFSSDTNYTSLGGSYYRLSTVRYLVSGGAVKPPRKLYWTEGAFAAVGKRVNVPPARVSAVKVVYNALFPERVETAYRAPGEVLPVDDSQMFQEKRTLWFDQSLGIISAFNREGRVFVELLGNTREDGKSRYHLGFEVVDVRREANPDDVAVELGDRLKAYADGRSDALLTPDPLPSQTGQTFAFRHEAESARPQFYATRETKNVNDFLVYWMEAGVAGLLWPAEFARYHLQWPTLTERYSHFIRPLAATDEQARQTAVQLPTENAPVIEFQDEFDQPRAKLTEDFKFYTLLEPAYPAHRTLIRLNSGDKISFERVFSWLDQNLRATNFNGTVAATLAGWNATNSAQQTIVGSNLLASARVFTQPVEVGQRISAPAGETAATDDFDYLAGYIRQSEGTSFSVSAYIDPFVSGFAEAARGSIIPVNTLGTNSHLEVWWFRPNAADTAKGFRKIYWPSAIGTYPISWPAAPRQIVLASNDGSGALSSLEAAGAIYMQNDAAFPGFNPNEEHALMQGGQVYALRDDLNITSGPNFSSQPFVLLELTDADNRPSMRAFQVVREAGASKFEFKAIAGQILQGPMPLPLLAPPLAPPMAIGPRRNLNFEQDAWTVQTTQGSAPAFGILTLTTRPSLRTHLLHALQNVSGGTASAPTWFYPTSFDADAKKVTGVISSSLPYATQFGTTLAQPANAFRWKFVLPNSSGLAAGNLLVLSAPEQQTNWIVSIDQLGTESGLPYATLLFSSTRPDAATNATELVFPNVLFGINDFNAFRLSPNRLLESIPDAAQRNFLATFTKMDRKGGLWVYRGPHQASDHPYLAMQFYYKTLPGFFFPTLALNAQPPAGIVTPYLRPKKADGSFAGDPVYGNIDADDQIGDGNALPIFYRPVWPNAPTLNMAETLGLPKRGLPAVRGQSSLEIVYQQAEAEGAGQPGRTAAKLHDPTREKYFELGLPSSATRLNGIPDGVFAQVYQGKTYFPNLPPHLAERFFFDPSRSVNGALVLKGQFVDSAVGDDYYLLNVAGAQDLRYLRDLCPAADAKKAFWNTAINGLATPLEMFTENPARPGTYRVNGGDSISVPIGALTVVTNSDQAVDSYALTATGPGSGYVTLMSGNGRGFTSPDEPVAMHVIKVADALYRGEVKIVNSSNPLNEKVALQQVTDLAGQIGDYEFEWRITAPVDGAPPATYQNTRRLLLGNGTWSHLRYPLASDRPASIQSAAAARVANEVTTAVTPVSDIPFTAVATNDNHLEFAISPANPHRLVAGNRVTVADADGHQMLGTVSSLSVATNLVVRIDPGQLGLPAQFAVRRLAESPAVAGFPQTVVFREFEIATDVNYSQFWLSVDLESSLGARIYLDGQLVAQANVDASDTPLDSPPATLQPLSRVYRLGPEFFAGGVRNGATATHRFAIELASSAAPGVAQLFNLRLEAFESADQTALPGTPWLALDAAKFEDGVRAVLGESADVRSLSDNYLIMRYRASSATHASFARGWSQWTEPQLVEGWIKRVLAGINPFNQRVNDLFNNRANTDASIISQAGARWEGDVALNLDAINNFGLIEIYETVLRRGRGLSIDAGINYGPANDALLLAAGYLNDLYMMLGNEAWADAANPTIGIGTSDKTYGDVATALFAFKGQTASLLEEELALLRGRDDFAQPGVEASPVYNRLVWNYTRGIDAGEVIYALNYNIQENNDTGVDGVINADDARKMFPQGHGDAYGHFLTAVKGYYSLLMDADFDWAPRAEAVTVLGKPVQVDYQDERKFAAGAAALARAGRQIFDLTWRQSYLPGKNGWAHFHATRDNTRRAQATTRYWGMDHWAKRTEIGAYVNWVVGNAIVPDVDLDPTHEGVQKIDRATVPELAELATIASDLQVAVDNSEAGLTPLGLPDGALAFDINPAQATGANGSTHFEQIYDRATGALRNALAAFDDAKGVTQMLRSEQDSLASLQAAVSQQELAYEHSLIEIYGSPYPDDVGPGKTYATGYTGPDLLHSAYVDNVELKFPGLLEPDKGRDYKIDTQQRTGEFDQSDKSRVYFIVNALDQGNYLNNKQYVSFHLDSHGFFQKPAAWHSRRASPGKVQEAISGIIIAQNALSGALNEHGDLKYELDRNLELFTAKLDLDFRRHHFDTEKAAIETSLEGTRFAIQMVSLGLKTWGDSLFNAAATAIEAVPASFIAGTAFGGDSLSAVRSSIMASYGIARAQNNVVHFAKEFTAGALDVSRKAYVRQQEADVIGPAKREFEDQQWVYDIERQINDVQNSLFTINQRLQELDDAHRNYRSMLAQADRILAEREIFRKRSAALVQGFRTRDAAFRIFRSEKLERYKTLFDLAARYSYLAANAYDYETGLLGTDQGKSFVNRILSSRALGVMRGGQPQYAGSNTGDPGLSSVLAEMSADWGVLRGRLGFNNPDAYGTTLSLRTENFRILPSADGDKNWKDLLQQSRVDNLLDDPDVRRNCLQIQGADQLPAPGIVLAFETTIADGLNLFGKARAAGDHWYSPSSFATKIFSSGIAFEGYRGMDNPSANAGTVAGAGGASPTEPSFPYLDADALGATPYIYLIPVGVDAMRSPPLGDASAIRNWNVADVAVPLPFNIGASDFSSRNIWQSSDSITETFFAIRKHQAFRPVPTAAAFTKDLYGPGGGLLRSQYANNRLIGRSVWNTRWKIVIPGRELLSDPNEGLDRFIRTVKDVKLHFVTYSYSGN
jgi:hypothetical protein